ncbi:MAG: low specificity L-threonine aldolase [Actinobacteria bacterium]|uniref:GntG family PLP-dependent aldolase n=1 Tax=Nostocoides veronense TaxID=330836 RepID=A0ABN2LJJ4_9MICO|nr:low specificity L-threonine aldolase [Actinomycetota bacterium]
MAAYAVDLLSDTLTRPSRGMRTAMADAEVGDDVFGEDPTVRRLEVRVAELLGHEAGLFSPTGSLANQLGLRLHVTPGRELIADSMAHILRAELGAAAAFSGITSRTWVSDRGRVTPEQALSLMIAGADIYHVPTALIALENTHNFGGGTILPLATIEAIRAGSQPHGVAMHLDGARLWNAHIATGVALADYGRHFDTVSVCLSKGLGAPVGSVLVGSADLMREARVWRKRYGAGMRQVGVLAAAGLFALDHNLERLADDHARARRFAEAVSSVAPVVDPAQVETNIVILDLADHPKSAADVVSGLAEAGVRAYALSPTRVRLVWHLDVDDPGTDRAIAAARAVLARGGRVTPRNLC